MTSDNRVVQANMFFCKLVPNRPAFPADMTPDEAAIMQAHFEYWTALLLSGKVLAFGPVSDPSGTYGMGILNAADENEVTNLTARDPACLGGLVRPEICPMRVVVGAQALTAVE